MFEITGDDVARLSDTDFRTLIARLAIAELARQGLPTSAVTAGGNQDAKDGGIDVRIELTRAPTSPDFVPRRCTGFQVKKPDMSPASISEEMRPKGKLRPAIGELADNAGSYIIVSAQGSVADKPLADRRKAVKAAIADHRNAGQIHTDFYDRERIANWVNSFPGVAAWVRERSLRHLSGWRAVGNWTDSRVGLETEYLSDGKTCLVDERSRERAELAVETGIDRLRDCLREHRTCVRLIGLSGLGKTRLVQALFETGVGGEPLDAGAALYTDYSETPDPTARDMARHLVETGQRAILVVDNCNPAIHSELAKICSTAESQVSLITVEYDVKDDEPERTEVFRLEAASRELLAKWLRLTFPHIQEPDRDRIAQFSDGNFRVARALAETLPKGETLGHLKDRELFARIFQQRNEPNENLLRIAEDLALLYSFDGEDTSNGSELAAIGRIRGISAPEIFAATVELRRRGVIQTRGRWRAILPQAIANRLASYALERTPPADLDDFAAGLSSRMLKSLTRRVGYLHDVPDAQATVTRWLNPAGPFGDLIARGDDGLQIFTNLAPVAPEAALARIELELDGADSATILALRNSDRWRWINLIKALAYEQHMFEDAAVALARFVSAEVQGDKTNDSAERAFGELFHLYLSGTKATPSQRRELIRRLADSGDFSQLRAASIALDALLEAGHFSATHAIDFGARPRDWGWHPTINKDICDWYDEAISLAVLLADRLPEVRSTLAGSVRDLWRLEPCRDAIERAALSFASSGAWIEGWLAFRGALRFDGDGMRKASHNRLKRLIERIAPTDLLDRARAYVMNRGGGWDLADGEEDDKDYSRAWERASALAQDIGRALATESSVRKSFLPEVIADQRAPRAFECGRGLAEGADDLSAMWQELVAAFRSADFMSRDATLLGGFMFEAHQRDPSFSDQALEHAIDDVDLSPMLPYLQGRAGVNDVGIARLRRAIARGSVQADRFAYIANGIVRDSPAVPLSELLFDIAELSNGVEVALDILNMRFYCDKQDGQVIDAGLVECGRDLLQKVDLSEKSALRNSDLQGVIKVCLAGSRAAPIARVVCKRVRDALDAYRVSIFDIGELLAGLLKVQPFVALDELLLPSPPERNSRLFEASDLRSPVEQVETSILETWADRNPDERYPIIGQCVGIVQRNPTGGDIGLSPKFLQLLVKAPDKAAFLGDFWLRIHPRGWSGSLADVLVRRREMLRPLESTDDPAVRQWFLDIQPELDQWIARERERERGQEESFE